MTENIEKEVFIQPVSKANLVSIFADIWRSKHLVSYFFIRSLHQRCKGTVIGWGWLIIKPLIPVLMATVIFGKLAKISSDDTPYLLFSFTGFAIWNLFNSALVFMTRSIRNNRQLFSKLYFPRMIVPITSIAPAIVEFFVTFCVLFIIIAIYFIKDGKMYLNLSPSLLLTGYFIFITIILTIGIGLWTSVLNAQARDIRFTLPHVLQIWVFVTPVIYPLSFIPQQWKWLIYLNPMTVPVEGYKWCILGKGEMHIFYWLLNAVIVFLIFLSGVWFFKKAETAFVDSL